jgi:hypothetical protein
MTARKDELLVALGAEIERAGFLSPQALSIASDPELLGRAAEAVWAAGNRERIRRLAQESLINRYRELRHKGNDVDKANTILAREFRHSFDAAEVRAITRRGLK